MTLLPYMRLPLLAFAMLALLAGLWAGLLRLGWALSPLQPTLPAVHGPLMVSGFLGTLIGLERAVALGRPWTYAAPLLSGLGGLVLLAGVPGPAGPALITLGSLGLVAILVLIVRLRPAPFTITMALGAFAWLVGNALWVADSPVYIAVPWWVGFLVLTIAGERFELGRLLMLSRLAQTTFVVAIGLLLAGLVLSIAAFDAGERLLGVGMVGLALWLLNYDMARRMVKQQGMGRFIALALLFGHLWLGVSGLLAIALGGVTAGPLYDAFLHSLFLGFVVSMVFGHAPIIFPAVLGRAVSFRQGFYAHLLLLHLSLILRVGADLTGWLPGRQWGGLLNAIALLLFLVNTVRALLRPSARGRVEG